MTPDVHSKTQKLLEISELEVSFIPTDGTPVLALENLNLVLNQGECLGLVGESGSGKSLTALATLNLIPKPGLITHGDIHFFSDKDSQKRPPKRGQDISMIFQEPMTSLNPVFTCGQQIEDVIRTHFPHLSAEKIKAKCIQALKEVGIAAPERGYGDYPHQLSGGMRQRVMIAMALACESEILIADEATTALDVTIQAQILDLMSELKRQKNLSLLLITHDLGIVAEMADRVSVMYSGQIVETGPVKDVFTNPRHPYTQGLLKAQPKFGMDKSQRLQSIPGSIPNLYDRPKGCRFHPRCEKAQNKCKYENPKLEAGTESKLRTWACHYPLDKSSV